MISKEELLKIAGKKGIFNRGYAEKDYLLELMLSAISSETKDELVFKGGTCISKFYAAGRFSEDLDFSAVKKIDIDKLLSRVTMKLKQYDIEAEITGKKEPFSSILTTIHAKGPLYTGDKRTMAKLRVDINFKSEVVLPAETKMHVSIYPDIPPFSVIVMREEEIFAEKVRAALTRNKPRDVYDLWLLLEKGVSKDMPLIKQKLKYYNMDYNETIFKQSIDAKEGMWQKDLAPLVFGALPSFNEAKKKILSAFRG